eukprot:gene10144-biopygen6263
MLCPNMDVCPARAEGETAADADRTRAGRGQCRCSQSERARGLLPPETEHSGRKVDVHGDTSSSRTAQQGIPREQRRSEDPHMTLFRGHRVGTWGNQWAI